MYLIPVPTSSFRPADESAHVLRYHRRVEREYLVPAVLHHFDFNPFLFKIQLILLKICELVVLHEINLLRFNFTLLQEVEHFLLLKNETRLEPLVPFNEVLLFQLFIKNGLKNEVLFIRKVAEAPLEVVVANVQMGHLVLPAHANRLLFDRNVHDELA